MSLLQSSWERQLESLTRADSTPQRLARKCEVILLAVPGVPNDAIAQQSGLSRPTGSPTGAWKLSAPSQKRNQSRPVRTPELEQKILDTTLKYQTAGRDPVERARARPPDGHFPQDGELKISHDPKFEEKVRDVVGLYLNPPDLALVLCVDEKAKCSAGSHGSHPDFATQFAGTAHQ